MPKRKAKYIVSTTKNQEFTFSGNSRKINSYEDPVVLFKKDSQYRERKNPRVKTRHSHETHFFSDDEGSSTMINWTFTNKKSADRASKRMKNR